VKSGIAAADPDLLPVGSVVNVAVGDARYNGIYTVMDTGPAIQGRILDLYMWSCIEAQKFGRRTVQVQVLRLGWNPRATTPSLVDRIFRSRQVQKPAAPKPAPEGNVPPATLPPSESTPAAPAASEPPVVPATALPDPPVSAEPKPSAAAPA
jgi:rare lipoprotein A (peptidoglycan hydrolase)